MHNPDRKLFSSRAKLMVSGEYMVLRGALSLALPLKFGQQLSVVAQKGIYSLHWESWTNDKLWFSASMSLPDLKVTSTSLPAISDRLANILSIAQEMSPGFLEKGNEYKVTSTMDFLPEWGIGSGSSLISNIAWWADCDPYELNRRIFNGSGYDIACARASAPIFYQLQEDQPVWRESSFAPSFSDQLYFIYLNRKQDTRKSIRETDLKRITSRDIRTISLLTIDMEKASDVKTFINLMDQHEKAIGEIIEKIPVKIDQFPDFEGSVKSLGAWGGDFIMAASSLPESSVFDYFRKKKLTTIFKYDEIVSNHPDKSLKMVSGTDTAERTNLQLIPRKNE
jgi:hypothetical protein